MMRFYCVEGGQTKGPFSLEELKGRGLKSIDLVCPQGETKWVRIDSIQGWSKIQSEVRNAPLSNSVKPVGTGEPAFESPKPLSERIPEVVSPEIEGAANPVARKIVGASAKSSFDDSIDSNPKQIDSAVEPSTSGKDAHQTFSHEEDEAVRAVTSQATSKMGFWEAYALGWSRFTDFHGRSRRLEYWSWSLVNFIIMLSFIALRVPFGLGSASSDLLLSLYVIFFVVCVIPGVALSIRRLHDIGLTGWWILITIVPYASLLLLVFAFVDSQKETNKWGSSPKHESSR